MLFNCHQGIDANFDLWSKGKYTWITYCPDLYYIFNGTLNWKKSTVAFRVQSYIDGGLDKDLIDPDNGENIARKRRKLGIDGGNAAAIHDEFMFPPSTAMWKKIADGPTLLPEFSLANMMAYFVTR